MQKQPLTKEQVTRQLKGFDKESHAQSLANGIMRSCKDADSLQTRVEQANAVVSSLRERGVTSFFAAEYAKVFTDPVQAMATREKLIAEFETRHDLKPKHAAKMADCIVFASAKKASSEYIERLALLSAKALRAVVPFEVVADVIYYSPADVDPATFAKRCVATSLKKDKPLVVSEVELAARLNN